MEKPGRPASLTRPQPATTAISGSDRPTQPIGGSRLRPPRGSDDDARTASRVRLNRLREALGTLARVRDWAGAGGGAAASGPSGEGEAEGRHRHMSDRTPAGRAAFFTSLAFLALIAVFDLMTGAQVNASSTVALAPFLAATLCSVRRTLIVTILTVVTGSILLVVNHTPVDGAYSRIFALAFVSVVALIAAAAREQRERRIAALTRVADVAQQALLIPAPPVVGPVNVASRYHSASTEALVGGDLYAVVETDHSVRLILGDVRGKGLESVAQSAAVISAFRDLAAISPTLDVLTVTMEDRLAHILGGEDFVTAVLAEVDDKGNARLVSCGHPPPVLVRDDSCELVEVADYATPFGLDPQPDVQHLTLQKADRLLFYTDGLIETRTKEGVFISLDDVIVGITDSDLDVALDSAVERIDTLSGDVRDDLALLLVEFHGQPGLHGGSRPKP